MRIVYLLNNPMSIMVTVMIAIINGKLVFPDEVREGVLLIDGKRIIAAGGVTVPACADTVDAAGLYVGPGLIDQHVHGYHQHGEGYDIIDNCRKVAESHLRHGVTSITPSPSYSLRMDRYLAIIEQCNDAISEGGNPIIGIHLEGPYINHRLGAGRKYAWKYSDEAFRTLFTAGGKNILHCTYAPEMPFAVDVENMIHSYGVVADLGHTEASPSDIYRAVGKGAGIITHLFDATGNCHGIHSSDLTGDAMDGVSQVALGIPGLYYEIISDSCGIHASKAAQKLAWRCGGEDHVILVSDCTYHKRADEEPEGYHHPIVGHEELTEYPQDVNINREGRLFGSRITVADGAKNFKNAVGCDVRQTFRCASTNSAEALRVSGRVGSILPGRKADLVFVDEDFNVQRIFFEGTEIGEVRHFSL